MSARKFPTACLAMVIGFFFPIYCVSRVAAVALNLPNTSLVLSTNRTSDPTEIVWSLDSPNPISTDASSKNVTLSNSQLGTPRVPKFTCNGAAYGRNLNLASCKAVVDTMSNDHSIVTFGERRKGNWDANLPFRWLSHDGRCAIDLGHKQNVDSDVARAADLKEVAQTLLSICVGVPPNEGGLVSNLGEDGNLLLRMVKYKPTVTCGPEDSGPAWPTCRYVVDNMPTDGRGQTFGPKEDQETTVALPWRVTAGPRKCAMILDSTEAGDDVKDTGNWYTMWLAANAVDYMSDKIT